MGQFTIVLPDQDMIIAINETASGAGPAQHTLDLTWDFVRMVKDDTSLPTDPDATSALESRLKKLNIGNPESGPCSAAAASLSGKQYRITEGMIGPYGGNFMSGEKPDPIAEFRFSFEDEICRFSYTTRSGINETVLAALNGGRFSNFIGKDGDPTRIYLCNGIWEDEQTFRLECRFVESCIQDNYTFRFDGDAVHIQSRNNSAFQSPEPLKAEAVLCG